MSVVLVEILQPKKYLFSGYSSEKIQNTSLGALASYIQKSYPVKILSVSGHNQIPKVLGRLKELMPKVVGITFTTVEARLAQEFACRVKLLYPLRNPYTVAGGAHASFEYETLLRSGSFDYVIRGEGELGFEKLCTYLTQTP